MSAKTIEGIVENGLIRLRGNIALPENTRVLVIMADAGESGENSAHIRTPRLASPDKANDFRKKVVEAPRDAQI